MTNHTEEVPEGKPGKLNAFDDPKHDDYPEEKPDITEALKKVDAQVGRAVTRLGEEKPIYEGDVLKYANPSKGRPPYYAKGVYVVEWKYRGMFTGFGITKKSTASNQEVIGNIYENGDLLK